MSVILIPLGAATLLFVYAVFIDRDPDALDKNGEPKYRKKRKR